MLRCSDKRGHARNLDKQFQNSQLFGAFSSTLSMLCDFTLQLQSCLLNSFLSTRGFQPSLKIAKGPDLPSLQPVFSRGWSRNLHSALTPSDMRVYTLSMRTSVSFPCWISSTTTFTLRASSQAFSRNVRTASFGLPISTPMDVLGA